MPRISRGALCAALAAACALVLAVGVGAARAAGCGQSGYAYAGVEGSPGAHGVTATLTAQTMPQVQSGHVAAWVGVGGAGRGPGGSSEWLQAGLSSFPDGRNELYYELALPDKPVRYVKIADSAARSYRVAVLELAGRKGWWRVFLDGRAVSEALYLPGSHGVWPPVATSESWDGGESACNNRFDYAFAGVAAATRPGGAWRTIESRRVLQDAGYSITPSSDGFIARA